MDKLSFKLQNLNSAFQSLELAYRYLTVELDKLSLSNNLDLKQINQDSVIQNFNLVRLTLLLLVAISLPDLIL